LTIEWLINIKSRYEKLINYSIDQGHYFYCLNKLFKFRTSVVHDRWHNTTTTFLDEYKTNILEKTDVFIGLGGVKM
jgi:hypothetical protein